MNVSIGYERKMKIVDFFALSLFLSHTHTLSVYFTYQNEFSSVWNDWLLLASHFNFVCWYLSDIICAFIGFALNDIRATLDGFYLDNNPIAIFCRRTWRNVLLCMWKFERSTLSSEFKRKWIKMLDFILKRDFFLFLYFVCLLSPFIINTWH